MAAHECFEYFGSRFQRRSEWSFEAEARIVGEVGEMAKSLMACCFQSVQRNDNGGMRCVTYTAVPAQILYRLAVTHKQQGCGINLRVRTDQ